MGRVNSRVGLLPSPFRKGPDATVTVTATSIAYAVGPHTRARILVPSGRAVRFACGGGDALALAASSAKLDGGTTAHDFAVAPWSHIALVRDTAEVSDVAGVVVTLGT